MATPVLVLLAGMQAFPSSPEVLATIAEGRALMQGPPQPQPTHAAPRPPSRHPGHAPAPSLAQIPGVACLLQGVVKDRNFEKFSVETLRTEAAARKMLGDHGVAHYWDLCAAFAPE